MEFNQFKTSNTILLRKVKLFSFFEIPKSLGGFRVLDYSFGIPHFEPFDNQIEFASQLVALTLGIKETCMSCECKETK